MIRPRDTRFRRVLNAALTLLLLAGMGLFDAAHQRHHWIEAGGHAECDDGHRHDDRACAVFHAGLLAEAAFDLPVPVAPAGRILAARTLHRPAAPVPLAHAPRAPPRTS